VRNSSPPCPLFANILTAFSLPSRLSFARYVAGFVDGYCHHHPFIHVPTLSIHAHEAAPELTLAIAAVGAQYPYETHVAESLYEASRSMVLERGRRRDRRGTLNHGDAISPPTDMLKTVLLLATFATWQAKPQYLREALEYQSLLARSVREDGLGETQPDDGKDSLVWARLESRRSTELSAFCLLNMHCIVFGWPAMLLGSEISLRLPTSCKDWLAKDEESWLAAKRGAPAPVNLQETLSALLLAEMGDNSSPERLPVTSPFGNYIAMQALHQPIVGK
jgi:hypothetical protein